MKEVHIYIDGGCRGNPGLGAWALVIVDPEIDRIVKTETGSEHNTTNNRMEMTALIYSLISLSRWSLDSDVIDSIKIFSDSQLLVNTLTKGWKKNVNLDLWNKISEWLKFYSNKKIAFFKVKGHSGNKYNELADRLLNETMDNVK